MAYPELQQTLNIDLFVTIVNSWKPFTIVAKSSVLDICRVLGTLLIRKNRKPETTHQDAILIQTIDLMPHLVRTMLVVIIYRAIYI